MNRASLQNRLVHLAVETHDQTVLNQVITYFESLRTKMDWWNDLTPEQIKLIELGGGQIERGKTISHEEMRAKIDTLLGKIN